MLKNAVFKTKRLKCFKITVIGQILCKYLPTHNMGKWAKWAM